MGQRRSSQNPDALKANEAAPLVGMAPRGIYRAVALGYIPPGVYWRIGRDMYFSRERLLAWRESGGTPSTQASPDAQGGGTSSEEDEAMRLVAMYHKGEIDPATLSDRESTVVLACFGFLRGEKVTLTEIAQTFEISSSRASQIKFNALRKLRRALDVLSEKKADRQHGEDSQVFLLKSIRDEIARADAGASSQKPSEILAKFFAAPIYALRLPERAYGILANAEVDTVGRLVEMKEHELRRVKHIGPALSRAITSELRRYGILLGTRHYETGYGVLVVPPSPSDSHKDEEEDDWSDE